MAVKPINLALQGGGSHGAFTWGVLDALLEDEGLAIESISGTSAGAMNAAAVAQGMAAGGAEEARKTLTRFWSRVSRMAAFAPVPADAYDTWFGNFSVLPGIPKLDLVNQVAHTFSPYQFNPTGLNPLRGLVADMFDFEAIRTCEHPRLYIAATQVYTGKIRVFEGDELTADVLAASACLPELVHAIEIDGEPYWDGGYTGNPALFPLFYDGSGSDILLVQVSPVERRSLPTSRQEIDNRIDEIAFNGALLRELRAVEFVQRLMDNGIIAPGKGYSRIRMHRVGGDELTRFGASSKVRTDWPFLTELRDLGRKAVQDWLSAHRGDIGERDTLDLRAMFN